jgi:hypothetical protein
MAFRGTLLSSRNSISHLTLLVPVQQWPAAMAGTSGHPSAKSVHARTHWRSHKLCLLAHACFRIIGAVKSCCDSLLCASGMSLAGKECRAP